MNKPMLQLERLGFSYTRGSYARGQAVLHDISLAIPQGQFTCILGESGCGKSTLLRVIAGLSRPDSGQMTLNTQRIGFVFQDPALMAWRCLRDNITLPMRLAGVGKQASMVRAEQALARVGLSQAGDALPHTLSGGMKMRGSLARTLALTPDILLMDEPFGALDEITRNRLNDDLLAIWRETKPTVLFVTHSVQECAYLAERVLVMGAGAIHADMSLPPRPHGDFRNHASLQKRQRRLQTALQNARDAKRP